MFFNETNILITNSKISNGYLVDVDKSNHVS